MEKSDFTKKKYLPGHLGWHWKINRQIQCPDQKVWNFLDRQLKNGSLVTVTKYEFDLQTGSRDSYLKESKEEVEELNLFPCNPKSILRAWH